MEAGEAPRQSTTSAARPENVDPPRPPYNNNNNNNSQYHNNTSTTTPSTTPTPGEPPARLFRDPRTMATTAVASPATPYPGHFHHGYPPSQSAGVMSPIEPRRPSNDSESSHRQSLPSLSEIMLDKPGDPFSHSAPTSAPCPSSSTFPSPFNSTPRTFSDAQHAQYPRDGHSSPQPIHPPPSSFARHEVDRFPDPSSSSRPPFGRPGSHGPPPQLSGYSLPHPTSPSRQHPDSAGHRPSPGGGGGLPHPSSAAQAPPPPPPLPPHSHSYSQHPPHSSYSTPPSQLPPGQRPLPTPGPPRHPLSPSYGSAQITPSYEHPPLLPPNRPYGEVDYDGNSSAPGITIVEQRMDSWVYTDNLGRIAAHSRTVYNFAEAYRNIAMEQQQTGVQISQRLPTEREISEMLANVDLIRKSLEATREMVQVAVQNERHQREAKGKGAWDGDHEMTYEAKYQMPEVKKRRGRAAPPGRCHSCNRIDTPEWRRGPDGARTLCNACGLHYAKLERKRQSEMRGSRPKQMDE